MLDEIDGLPLELQPKLLRAIECKEYTRVGAQKILRTDVRLIFTSQRDLLEAVAKNEFRADLYERISILEVKIPPLRERLDDIPALVAQFIEKDHGGRYAVSDEEMEALQKYGWPRNVRELRHAMKRAALEAEDGLMYPSRCIKKMEHMEPGRKANGDLCLECYDESRTLKDNMERCRNRTIRRFLRENKWNVAATAKKLGMPRTTLESIVLKEGW